MRGYSELELVIQRDSTDALFASARHRVTSGDNITPFVRLDLDPQAPGLFSGNPAESGPILSKAIFTPTELRDAFVAASTYSANNGLHLRVRLRLDPAAASLHGIPWETMTHPNDSHMPLLRNTKCVFSRYLFTREFRLPMLRPKQEIQAVLAIANPRELSEGFEPVDVENQERIAKASLLRLKARTLTGEGAATLEKIMQGLRDGADILYLVCHGSFGPKGAALWLEDDSGKATIVTGEDFVARIASLDRPPSLIVLCSCESAGTGNGRNPMGAIGPMLASAGVPAVLAMQGKLSFDTAQKFMPIFFGELSEHGEVDRAASTARLEVMDRTDWWLPVLFTRLDSARIWYPPGFGSSDDGADPWQAIISNLGTASCTPILGPGMCDPYFGTRRELAVQWGEMYRYPMSGKDTEDLPQVAQYLAVTRQPASPRQEFYKHVYKRLLDRFPEHVPAELTELSPADLQDRLSEVVSAVGISVRAADSEGTDPHTVLARYRLPVYVTTDPSDLLVDALREQGAKHPRVRLLRWNDASAACDQAYVDNTPVDAPAKPTRDFPVVVKLFGDLSAPRSLVMTEDQFFDYLTMAAAAKDAVPPAVRSRLSDSGLLFIGFQADAWDFRVLFRSLLQLEGRDLRSDYAHFSVQIDPNSILDPGSARRYIEQYLQAKAKLRLYWGDVATFVAELKTRADGA
ncbi:CHAT domain-containing protein [Variovorax sp. OV700]|uniref:CHAT domain-containing protein n=1 Tax=Variovorax sp. OV700 TaxID=1882826 RepID=UPI00087E7B0E|nr:CHAT domain-containing protein [Variovorax sp. OV700]SDJ66676.1 SIR2-like domain-containing protein [Variovorax sp. OV700]